MPLISIIIPVYNVERFLPKCIDSILAQTFTDFEVILINDGSVDRSGDVCDRYAQRDSRIYVKHQKNSGASAARNVGINLSNGNYLCFVDSDDWLEQSFLESFKLDKYSADIYISREKELKFDGTIDDSSYSDTIDDMSVDFINKKLYLFVTPWAKLFRRDIINKINLRFDEKLTWAEDRLFYYLYILECKSMYFVNSADAGYNYLKEDIIDPKRRLTSQQHSYDVLLYISELFPDVIDKLSIHMNLPNDVITTLYNWNVYSSRFSALKTIFLGKNTTQSKYKYYSTEVNYWINGGGYLTDCGGIRKVINIFLHFECKPLSFLLVFTVFKILNLLRWVKICLQSK